MGDPRAHGADAAMSGEHGAALVALVYLPVGVTGLLTLLEAGVRREWALALRLRDAYLRTASSVRLAALGMAISAGVHLGRTIDYARGMAVLFLVLTLAGFAPQPLLGLVPLGGLDIGLHAATAVLAAAAGWLYRPRATVPA